MPLFAAFLGALFGKLVDWLGSFATKKAAAYAALTATTVGAFAVVVAVLTATINGLAVSMPEIVGQIAGWVLPGNITVCIAAEISVRLALSAYEWHRDTVRAAAAA